MSARAGATPFPALRAAAGASSGLASAIGGVAADHAAYFRLGAAGGWLERRSPRRRASPIFSRGLPHDEKRARARVCVPARQVCFSSEALCGPHSNRGRSIPPNMLRPRCAPIAASFATDRWLALRRSFGKNSQQRSAKRPSRCQSPSQCLMTAKRKSRAITFASQAILATHRPTSETRACRPVTLGPLTLGPLTLKPLFNSLTQAL